MHKAEGNDAQRKMMQLPQYAALFDWTNNNEHKHKRIHVSDEIKSLVRQEE